MEYLDILPSTADTSLVDLDGLDVTGDLVADAVVAKRELNVCMKEIRQATDAYRLRFRARPVLWEGACYGKSSEHEQEAGKGMHFGRLMR